MITGPIYVERECPNCKEKFLVQPVRLATWRAFVCPFCGTAFENNVDDIDRMIKKIEKMLKDLS